MKKVIVKISKWLLILACLVLGGTFFISYHTIKKSLGRRAYSPSVKKIIEHNRERLKQEFHAQDVSFVTDDGIQLQGYLLLHKDAQRNIVICHGYRSAKELLIDFASMFEQSNLLFFDFRAHGQSEGSLVTLGHNEKKDVLSAIAFLHTDERTKNLPLFGIGISMGGVALLAAAAEKPAFKALVIDSAFASLDKQIATEFKLRTGLPRYPFLWITRKMFEYATGIVMNMDVREYVRKIDAPILFIHALADPQIMVENVYALAEAARHKKVWLVEDGSHAFVFNNHKDEYAQTIKNFFNSI